MLSIPRPALAAAAVLLLLPVLTPPPAARADSTWVDDTQNTADTGGGSTVTVGAKGGGRPGSTGTGGGGGGSCQRADGSPVPCSTDLGWWSATHNCYLSLVREAGPEDAGHAGEGWFRCNPGASDLGWAGDVFVWAPLAAAGPDPAVLAQQAVDSMRLRPLDVGLTPPAGAGTPTLVGLPVWMWVANPGPETYGPNTASATAGAVTVTATAKVSSVTWDMGDGTLVNCGQGTPYTPGQGAAASPSCGHRYERPGTYAITATSNWVVDWAGGGTSGRITLSLDSTAGITAAEAYGLVERRG